MLRLLKQKWKYFSAVFLVWADEMSAEAKSAEKYWLSIPYYDGKFYH